MKLPETLKPEALGRYAVTALVVLAALYAGWRIWQHYELDPWTRDGHVRADVVQVAPDVSGLVTAMLVHDNQDVHAGDVLFEIDRARFQLALDQAQAALTARQVARDQAARDVKRNQGLGQLVSAEALEQSRTRLEQSEADIAQAVVQVHTAQLNLKRSQVLASASGRVTNLDLHVGSYANAGRPLMALIDANSFYVE
ncbi:MAG TPA: biotin/lipoyl-binding protein, partial [Bordetella sp.]